MLVKKILLLFMALLLLTGCNQKTEEKKSTEAKNVEENKETNKETKNLTFSFLDVKGNKFDAPLIENIKKHNYEYKRLKDNNGYYYYTDEQGKVISKLGIDVSKYQKNINWQEVKNSGIDFVIIRLGYRGYGESGFINLDEMYQANVEGAQAAGLLVGVYFFSQAINKEEALEEADFVLEHIQQYNITYPVIFDTEVIEDPDARTFHLEKKQFTDNCIVFCDRILEAGYDTMIYANMKWMAFTLDLQQLEKYNKWYADYEKLPQIPYQFTMWQYTEQGTVNGVEGPVDLNIVFDSTSLEN